MKTIGVISDTHGLLRQTAFRALQGVDLIAHAGDVGSFAVLEALREIAPVHAVRGNMDGGKLGASLAPFEVVNIDDILFYVLHDINRLDLDLAAAGFAGVIYGHSHQPACERRNNILYLNPGSAGPKRFNKPVTLALMTVKGSAENFDIDVSFTDLEE